jgi:tRNA (mo5U34)-methyltransferase
MKQIDRERRVDFGPVGITVSMPNAMAERIATSAPYRKVLRPLAGRLGHLGNDHAGGNGGPGVPSWAVPPEPPRPEEADPEARELIERIAGRDWYHTIELGHGVATPGFVDHRYQIGAYGLPDSLDGMRCLDVATFDGFWAFEFERRGAAEVVGIDVASWADCDFPKVLLEQALEEGAQEPTGAGFDIAHGILGSRVKRVISSVYDLSPETVGMFDLAFVSDLLLHLRDPQAALEAMASVCRGIAIVGEVYTPELEGFGDACLSRFVGGLGSEVWWLPNVNTLRAMMAVAGLESIREVSRFQLQARAPDPIHKVVLHGVASARRRERG